MTDVVIPLGTGSKNNDIELRFCLRSINKYLKGYRNVYIIGRCPAWISPSTINHQPSTDIGGSENKSRSIYNKIIAACNIVELSEDFLFFNDDHFLLQSVDADKFPYHHKGKMTIENRKAGDSYRGLIENTLQLFPNTNNFDTHCPILYNKEKFKALQLKWKPFGYGIKTVYCNTYNIEGEFYPDCKINAPMNEERIYSLLAGRLYFSIGDKAFGGVIVKVLEELFSNLPCYEI